MTELERAQIAALAACRFSPGSTEKRFVRDMSARAADYELSAKQAAFLDTLAHRYRKQIGRCLSASCAACKRSPVPVIRYEVDSRTNTKWGRIQRQTARPTFEQAVAALEVVESNGGKHVHWFHRVVDEVVGAPYSRVVSIHRCECGEVVLGANVCRTCQLIASLLVDTDNRGAQVQFERAERAQNRLAELVVELQRKARGVAA